MSPEQLSVAILSIAVLAVSLLVLADRAGVRSPLPTLHLNPRWMGLIWVLMVVLTALQALRLAGTL
jgi:hypothetical protein